MEKALLDKLQSDPYAKMLGIKVDEIAEGYAKVSMKIQENMLNFHGSTNGGVVFSLADVAFAIASNSHGQTAVGVNMNMSYMAASFPGEILYCEGKEETKNPKLGLYRMEVTNENGDLVAIAEGMVYRKKQQVVEG